MPPPSPSSSVRYHLDAFLSHQMHYFENERFLDEYPKLRKMVAYITFVLSKNRDFLTAEQEGAADPAAAVAAGAASLITSQSSVLSAASKAPPGARLERRGSLDLRRIKLIESQLTKKETAGVAAGIDVPELDFVMSLCQHLAHIVPRGQAALTDEIDEGLLGE